MRKSTGNSRDAVEGIQGGNHHRQARWYSRVFVSSGLICAMISALTLPSFADENRDEAAAQKDQAAASVENLKAQLEGIDANLAQVFLDLQAVNAQIPQAQKELDTANAAYEAASREHQVILGQLESAQAEQKNLSSQVEAAETEQKEASKAIANLARQMYRDGASSSAVVVALTASGTASIDDRAAAATVMSRSQSQALNTALDVEATHRTQVQRQNAVTERISTLEENAKKASDEAEVAQQKASDKVAELAQLRKDAQAKQADWDSKKTEANRQLQQAQADYDAKAQRLAQIDEENRRTQATSGVASSGWRYPVSEMIVTSPFGWRFHPVLGYEKLHTGTDFGASCGAPIYAVADGVVASVSSSESAGNYVDVNHGLVNGQSMVTEYLHMQAIYVAPGQAVTAGTVLGEVGATGYATGCHLHFGVSVNGSYVDPMNYF